MPPRRSLLLRAIAAACVVLAATGCTGVGAARRASPTSSTAPVTPTPAATTRLAESDLPGSVVALGDSLSRGFDACSHYGDCLSASWSTGTDGTVDSVADRLAAARGAAVRRTNVAESGVTSAALGRQVDRAIAAAPQLATVLIGANDVCRATLGDMTSTAVFADRVRTALTRLADRVPGITILVASVPDVPNLLPVVGDDPTAQFLWSRLGGCTTALADPASTAPAAVARRAAVTARIEAYNRALRSICAAIGGCVFDDGALFRYQPTAAQISPLDLFHPSIAGLRELAATQWGVLQRHWGLD